MQRICFLGCGHMAQAMIQGLLAAGTPAQILTAVRRDISQLAHLEQQGVNVTDKIEVVEGADFVFLGVRPQQLATLSSVLATLSSRHVLISMLAGTSIATLKSHAPSPIVARIMPNLACQVGHGVIGLYSPTDHLPQMLINMLCQLGYVSTVAHETDLDTVTALSGSGIAYFYQLSLALQQAAADSGIELAECERIMDKTVVGAGALLATQEKGGASHSPHTARTLVEAIAVPGGTTEQALATLNNQNALVELCRRAIEVVKTRCQQLRSER